MAKAQITTPSGMSIQLEGTPAEIRAVVDDLERKERKSKGPVQRTAQPQARPGRVTLAGSLLSLRDEGFFDQPRDLSSIKSELDAKGHFWPVTTLSGAVLGQVRKRHVRRLKKDDRWFYVRSG